MKAIRLLISLGVFLTALLVGGIALANDLSVFESVTSGSTLGPPNLTVSITKDKVTLAWNSVEGAIG